MSLNMKWTALIISVVVIVGFGIYLIFFTPSHSISTTTTTQTNPFGSPAGGISPGSSLLGTTTGSGTELPIKLITGATVSVPDFTKGNQPPTANATSGYQVAGSNTGEFQILYYPQGSSFLVSLLSEPIGETRLAAEEALRAQLGLSDAQLCSLDIEVDTPSFVNSTYAGQNLSLSFCPGSTELPN